MKGKFEKKVFPVDYGIKDLDLALVTGAKYHIPLYFGSLARQAYELARAAGYGDRYVPVVIRPLEELTGVVVRGDLEGNA
jgi:3-hydroxyisobutyrate dehydrogenase-like beta-hydroxyacid dehydrogenase